MRLLNNILLSGEFDMWKHSIFLGYRGSIAHGTYVPNSNPYSIDDKDVIGVAIPPASYTFGLKNFEHFDKFEGEWDVLVYDLRKFVRLLLKSNPNVMQVLWTPEKHVIKQNEFYGKLFAARHIFASKNIYASFCGYSQGQLHKMENMAYNGYMGEKRKALVDKFGFDTKNAQHLIRLLRQGIEFLQTGELEVERKDRAELIQIKQGAWSIEKVKRVASDLFKEMEQANAESKLPAQPDREAADKLVQEILIQYYSQELQP